MNTVMDPPFTSSRRYVSILFASIALTQTLVFNHVTHYITRLGYWYGWTPLLRLQSNAFLNGHLTLDTRPSMIGWDMIWYQGATHPWGWGVSFFRFLFDCTARLVGAPFFPDCLTLLIAYFSCAFFLLITIFHVLETKSFWIRTVYSIFICQAFLFVAPFVTIMSLNINLYEEAIVYSYLFTITLFMVLLKTWTRPSNKNLFLVSLLCGLAPYFRATLLAYSISTFLLILLKARRLLTKSTIAKMVVIFGSALVLLGYLNHIRFGSAFEFGSGLNLENFPDVTLLQKFGNPSQNIFAELRDTLGSLFFLRTLNGHNVWKMHLFPGQIAVRQWHEMYFSSVDVSHGILFIFGLFLGIKQFVFPIHTNTSEGDNSLKQVFATWGILWGFLSFTILLIFYSGFRFMTSRYTIDFVPAIMVIIVAFTLWAIHFFWKRSSKLLAMAVGALFVFWNSYKILSADIHRHYVALPHLSVGELREPEFQQTWEKPTQSLRFYEVGQSNPAHWMKFNGAGWNYKTGELFASTIFLASDPSGVTLKLRSAWPGTPLNEDDLEKIQAKIGLEFLKRNAIVIDGDHAVISFEGPKRKCYQTGLQICFLGWVAPKEVWTRSPDFRLTRIDF